MNICDYGCGQEGKYKFKNGKWCCSEKWQTCPIERNKTSKIQIGKIRGPHSEETKKKISETSKGKIRGPMLEKTKEKLRKINKGKTLSEETKQKIGESSKGRILGPMLEKTKEKLRKINKYSIEDWKEKYPTFGKVEEMRYDPEKPIEEKIIQVHCKNNKCKNSKEQGGWFTTSYIQLYERIRQLEHPEGNDSSYLYCSDECKNECPLFNLHSDPYSNKEFPYTDSEKETFRQEVLKRDNYICHFCGEQKAIIVHHTRPQKLEPFFSLDPDFGISVCEECHHFIHRSKEQGGDCSTGQLANIICV